MTTIRFNTKRGYTKFGQRITATLHDDGIVTFNDHDRMVTGSFALGSDPFDQRTVMHAYDYNIAQQDRRSWQDGMMADGCNANWIS